MMPDVRHDFIEAVRELLERLPGWSGVVLKEGGDAEYKVSARVRGVNHRFILDLKSGLARGAALEQVRRRVERGDVPVVLGVAWIPAKRAASLRDMGVNYLDTAGNAYLDLPGLHLFRETLAAPLVDPVAKRPLGSAFNASAVRVGLQLLLDPELVGINLRAIAALAGVSAPSAKFALDAFKADGYVIEVGKKGRRLVEREAFLRKWAESYNQRYRPKHALGRYSNGSSRIVLQGFEACWGGEAAADRLTNNLKPTGMVVYSHTGKVGPLVVKNRLRPDPKGEVELIQACWDKRQEGPHGTAPAFVVFADLLNTRDPRCIEVAERIFETVLKPKLVAHVE